MVYCLSLDFGWQRPLKDKRMRIIEMNGNSRVMNEQIKVVFMVFWLVYGLYLAKK